MALNCSNCSFQNPPGMRFCGNCGARLAEPLAEDDFTIPAEQAPRLGVLVGSDLLQRFRQAGLQSAGQRRTVTVLFADLCDYTGLSAKTDDEALFEIIQSYIEMLAEKVYQFEGMVDKITGDGLMALFGAPIALENPAERAVRAALEMQAGLVQLNRELDKSHGERLQMHWGLNRGTVIVGGIGSDLLVDYTAIGDSVNLARRLQEVAAEDSILVSESVYRTTRSLFEYREKSDLILKGYETGVKGYQVLGLKSVPERVRGLQGLHAPMIGREAELQLVNTALDNLLENKESQMVTLVGEAGIGKSRLTAEFKSRIDAGQVTLIEGQSLTYRKSVSYWIFLELLRNYFGIQPGTGKQELQSKLKENITALLGPESSAVLPLFEKLFSLQPSDPQISRRLNYLDAEQLKQQNFIAIRNLLLAIVERRPLVLILEDLHWADEISLDLLAFLIESINDHPLMILAITRPTPEGNLDHLFETSRQHFGTRCQTIHLDTLSEQQSDQLLFGLLGVIKMPAELRSQIIKRASGVPFYLEEMLRMLIDKRLLINESGGWILRSDIDLDLEVPDNLQDLILTRFDRLSPPQRSLLQTASVIGREFGIDLINQVLNNRDLGQLKSELGILVDKAFILPIGEQGYQGYIFRHVLTSDAVYRTLLRKDRNRLHGQVAMAIENVYAQELDGQLEVLAGHYLRSEYLDKALHYLILAGRKSAREYANLQAQRYFEEARNLLGDVEHSMEQAWQVWLGLGDVLVFIGEYDTARSCYLELVGSYIASRGAQFGGRQHEVYRKIATTYERQGAFDQALEQLEIASQKLNSNGDLSSVAKAQILNDKGWIQFLRGNFMEARSSLEEALALVSGSDELSVVASINNRLGAVSYQLRDYKKAASYVRESLALRKMLADLSGEARLYNNLGLLGLMSGDLQEAESNFYHSVALLEKVGDTEGIALANINLGLVKFDLGDYEAAHKHLETAVSISERIGHRFYLGLGYMYLGRLKSSQNDFSAADTLLAQSQEIFEQLGAQDNLVDAYCYRTENCLAWGDLESAKQWCRIASSRLAKDGGELANDSVQSGRVLRLQGSLARIQGDLQLSDQYLQESAEIFQLAMEKLESARTAYEIGLLALDQGDQRKAQENFEQASQIFTEVGARKENERVKSRLEAEIV